MNIEITNHNGIFMAELIAEEIVIIEVQDALDIMANAAYAGATKLILHEKNITPDFFDLKTKIAGEILQKFSNYNMPLAIVGDFSKYTSKSLRDFIYESNNGRSVNFVSSVEEAKEKLARR
ncbi:DUF4180 domain-containing protein [Emticicia sp. C21]|uniref:DUF4180 domain-containing protein n=1 Tax=Emticicia sp. C21 TaxID=2302915 RepID=UPI000E356A02|nr:DUF4180 domain-containing protein [Emticicia sp. C21]RFS18592.1 DUF4180 domain-containing protein [Emticicia sp. C21]